MGKRIEFLDLLKLLAILMVVFTHIFQNHIEGAYATPLYNVIWLVQMPLFMAVSGWLSSTMDKVSSASKLGKSIGRKILFYVYPCFTYIILMSAFESLRTGRNWALGQEFLNFFLDPEYGLWFLWVLWLISTIFDLGTYFASKFHFHYRDIVVPYLLLLLFSGFIVGLMFYGVFDGKILGLKLCAFYIIFYIEGNLLKRLHNSGPLCSLKSYQIFKWLFFCVSLCVFIFEVFYFKSIFSFSDRSFLYLGIRVIGSLAACYWLFVGAEEVCRIVFSKPSQRQDALP